MRKVLFLIPALLCGAAILSQATAQPPGGKGGKGGKGKGREGGASSLVERMMKFDKDKDGKLTKEEVTDERLLRLFEQADTNKDGVVTKEELEALAKKLDAEGDEGRGKGGFGGPERRGKGGPGGPGGFGGPGGMGAFRPPQPGQILPPFLADRLELTADQKKDVEALQKDVDARLAKILTEAQKKQLKQMSEGFGPGGRGPGGRGGPGRPGGEGRPE